MPLVGNDLIGNIVGGCPRETGSGYSGSAGLGERGGVLVHHYAGSYVAVDRNTGDRPRSGLIERLSRMMRPVLHFLFPHLSPDSEAARQISINFIANILGLGWAATPAGLKGHGGIKKRKGGYQIMADPPMILLQQLRICAPF